MDCFKINGSAHICYVCVCVTTVIGQWFVNFLATISQLKCRQMLYQEFCNFNDFTLKSDSEHAFFCIGLVLWVQEKENKCSFRVFLWTEARYVLVSHTIQRRDMSRLKLSLLVFFSICCTQHLIFFVLCVIA